MDENRFGFRLRELRERAGLTQAQLADAVGVKVLAVTRWERGEREPGWSNIVALAAALGVDCTAFTQEPASSSEPRPRGRPKKPAAEPEAESPPAKPKKTRKRKKG